jgi:tellurite resistance protein TerC
MPAISHPILAWTGFIALILFLLAVDLGLVHRGSGRMSTSSALKWTAVWIVISLLFSGVVYVLYEGPWGRELSAGLPKGMETLDGKDAVFKYLTGYLIEKLLSLDNIFVIAVILSAFKVPEESMHRVLYWGILGALVLRGIMIGAGTAALREFHWLIYPLGVVLVWTAYKMLRAGEDGDDVDVDKNPLVRAARLIFPVAPPKNPGEFFVRHEGKVAITPVFLALLAVEASDVLFAVDSVPAIFAVTLDPFIVFTSNIFAILGLRSLFFALQSMLGRFRLLKPALAGILAFVGVKMLISAHVKVPPLLSLLVIVAAVSTAIVLSLVTERRGEQPKSD